MKNNILSNFFYQMPQNFARIFRGKNLLWHALAIALTFLCVVSGLDWAYYKSTQIPGLRPILFAAVILGFFMPLLLPFILLFYGKARKNLRTINTGFALGQAGGLGWLLSACYKFFTGRPGPENVNILGNISHLFKFGFFRGGIFWGWPSSHTTVAFAIALALCTLYPENKIIKILALIFAIYIGLSVSMTIHWFSDFAAGIIFGSLVGIIVGKSFLKKHGTGSKT